MDSSEQNNDIENADSLQINGEKLDYNTTNAVYYTTQIDGEQPSPYQEPTQPTQPTLSKSIYRFDHSDMWGCNKCKSKGDKWFMIKHVCKGASK